MTAPQWTDAMHQHIEWECAVAYEQGWRDCTAWASASMDAAIEAALGTTHSYQANGTPVHPTAAEVVRRMVRAMTTAAHREAP
jgi:hypothetical protein